jgi:hypothetical protein
LTTKRAQIIARLKQMGAKDSAILAAVGAEKTEDIDLARLEVLIGLGTAIKDGEITLETAFPGTAPKEEGKPIFKEEPKAVEPTPATPQQPAAASITLEPTNTAQEPAASTQERLGALVTEAGFDLKTFSVWAVEAGFIDVDADSWATIPDAFALRCVKGATGLIKQLKGVAK